MSFLKAEWRKLAIANYAVDDDLLRPYLPYKTELDKWNNTTYVSLVAFRFLNTRILGVKVPFHINFEEVNLRFYVLFKEADEWKRGVVFVREIVPKRAITFVANRVYKENYRTLPTSHKWIENDDHLHIRYGWKINGTLQEVALKTDKVSLPIPIGSEEEFITEHYWGYAQINDSKTHEYEVTHPRWQHYPVIEHELNANFGLLYGDRFGQLSQQTPTSVMLAEGSEITVEKKRVIQ